MENTYTNFELNLVISERFIRKIDNASSLKYKNNYYIPTNFEFEESVNIPNKNEINKLIAYDKSFWCIYENEYYKLKN